MRHLCSQGRGHVVARTMAAVPHGPNVRPPVFLLLDLPDDVLELVLFKQDLSTEAYGAVASSCRRLRDMILGKPGTQGPLRALVHAMLMGGRIFIKSGGGDERVRVRFEHLDVRERLGQAAQVAPITTAPKRDDAHLFRAEEELLQYQQAMAEVGAHPLLRLMILALHHGLGVTPSAAGLEGVVLLQLPGDPQITALARVFDGSNRLFAQHAANARERNKVHRWREAFQRATPVMSCTRDGLEPVRHRIIAREAAWQATADAVELFEELFQEAKDLTIATWKSYLHELRGQHALVDAIVGGDLWVRRLLVVPALSSRPRRRRE
tara:strand:- start:192 stop:1160 length:969 start_codon:yes stop_codon:yes gene_type:complete